MDVQSFLSYVRCDSSSHTRIATTSAGAASNRMLLITIQAAGMGMALGGPVAAKYLLTRHAQPRFRQALPHHQNAQERACMHFSRDLTLRTSHVYMHNEQSTLGHLTPKCVLGSDDDNLAVGVPCGSPTLTAMNQSPGDYSPGYSRCTACALTTVLKWGLISWQALVRKRHPLKI